jgi:hypothetical protein
MYNKQRDFNTCFHNLAVSSWTWINGGRHVYGGTTAAVRSINAANKQVSLGEAFL